MYCKIKYVILSKYIYIYGGRGVGGYYKASYCNRIFQSKCFLLYLKSFYICGIRLILLQSKGVKKIFLKSSNIPI